jgi:hypothetical protein
MNPEQQYAADFHRWVESEIGKNNSIKRINDLSIMFFCLAGGAIVGIILTALL